MLAGFFFWDQISHVVASLNLLGVDMCIGVANNAIKEVFWPKEIAANLHVACCILCLLPFVMLSAFPLLLFAYLIK